MIESTAAYAAAFAACPREWLYATRHTLNLTHAHTHAHTQHKHTHAHTQTVHCLIGVPGVTSCYLVVRRRRGSAFLVGRRGGFASRGLLCLDGFHVRSRLEPKPSHEIYCFVQPGDPGPEKKRKREEFFFVFAHSTRRGLKDFHTNCI